MRYLKVIQLKISYFNNPPTLLASRGGSEVNNRIPYYLYFPPPSTVLLYYRTAILPYYRKDRTTVKTVRPFDRRPNVYSISREVREIPRGQDGPMYIDMGLPMSMEPFLLFFYTLTWDSPCQWTNF